MMMMMMNGIIFGDNMSNLTSGSNELASVSSSSRNEVGGTAVYPQQESFASTPNQLPAAKKKRNLPGNPDPDAEVVALSPRTLMATNRFICEICNKGFQRDQNLQLHRRGHNLPWKLKQRANKEEVVKKKVYVCPEATCVHHEPARALGDLTGIKKHFSRKHGEKKWKCEKCSKRYAVQSDWKAHSKICGTREYRCDCGTLFSRRDSFITHRAFCDALAEERTRSLTTNPLLSTQQQQPIFNLQSALIPLMKKEQDLPQPWLASQLPPSIDLSSSSSSRLESNQPMMITHHPQNPNPRVFLPPSFQPHTTVLLSSSPHMSATALLQKAAQMSAMSSSESSNSVMIGPHQADDHMIAKTTAAAGAGLLISSTSLAASTAGSGGAAGLSSRQGLSFGNKPHVNVTSSCMEQMGATTALQGTIHDMMITTSSLPSDASSTGFGGSSSSSFEEAFNGMFNPKMGNAEGGGGGGDGNKGLSTRDFLGLRGFSHRGFSTMPGLDQINLSPPFDQRNQN